MNILDENPHPANYSAREMAKPVNFYCEVPKAHAVQLVGDFNLWNPITHPMTRRVDGWWFLEVPLAHGHHQYRFLVDGKPTLDPRATGIAHNEHDEEVSLIAIS
jgi:1,4-alpha-glucan branching enzyme